MEPRICAAPFVGDTDDVKEQRTNGNYNMVPLSPKSLEL